MGCVELASSTYAEDCSGFEGGRTAKAHDATYDLVVSAIRDGEEIHRSTLASSGGCPLSEWFARGSTTADVHRPPAGVDEAVDSVVAVPDTTGVVPSPAPAIAHGSGVRDRTGRAHARRGRRGE